eukprot:765063-Hanusia_phi.AAC.8
MPAFNLHLLIERLIENKSLTPLFLTDCPSQLVHPWPAASKLCALSVPTASSGGGIMQRLSVSNSQARSTQMRPASRTRLLLTCSPSRTPQLPRRPGRHPTSITS